MKTTNPPLSPELLDDLRRLDSSTLANAIETFHVRLFNEGFTDGHVKCLFPNLSAVTGYAATMKIRGSLPPTAGKPYIENTDWWDYLLSLPAPRAMVIEDVSTNPGTGSLLGAVHINILRALGCVCALTNGAVRDVRAAEALGFPLFAGRVAVSHAYIHVLEFGTPVLVDNLKVHSGDLLHADRAGIQSIPLEIAPRIPPVAARIAREKAALIALCQSTDFSPERLRAALTESSKDQA